MGNDGGKETALSGDFFRGLCDNIFWCNDSPRENAAFRHGDVVFCKIDEVWRFFRALRRTRRRVVLVTGEGDKPVDQALWNTRPPQVAFWWGTNMEIEAKGARGLPLGLGNASGRKTIRLVEISAARACAPARDRSLYANFSAHSNRTLRGELLRWLDENPRSWITRGRYDEKSGHPQYISELVRHRFVLCPPGNGEDTHRFWEALYAGAFPVIRCSTSMKHFSAAPALALADLREVSETRLAEFARQNSGDPASCGILRPDHWRAGIARDREAAKSLGRVGPREWMAGWWREFRRIARRS
jgi:hypothetical protein